jgi:hypothetical protein
MQRTIDITDLLFPEVDLTAEEEKRGDLYRLACEEADKIVSIKTPINLYNKTLELYKDYLKKENLKYDEERGF